MHLIYRIYILILRTNNTFGGPNMETTRERAVTIMLVLLRVCGFVKRNIFHETVSVMLFCIFITKKHDKYKNCWVCTKAS